MASPNDRQIAPTVARIIALLAFFFVPLSASGQTDAGDKVPSFEQDIQPILAEHCLKCHGGITRKGGLDLRSPASISRGGTSGPALVVGSAEKSLLFEQIDSRVMPPGEKKLTVEQVRTIRDWINAGARGVRPDRPAADSLIAAEDRQFWSFRPPVRPAVPAVRHAERVRTAVDAFVLAKLESKGLGFSPDAEPATLLRRVYLDLLGLPPSSEEATAYLVDRRPDAYERLINRLLASPHYGERWGRHWLDAAGYSEMIGSDQEPESHKTYTREGMWRYRDYVVRAFNEDKAYDRFLTEQLAGDELVDWRSAPTFTPEIRELLIATGYLRTAVDDTCDADLNRPQERYEVLHNTLTVLGTNLLGLTLTCARCHDHKYDPIPQEDYYGLVACFQPVYNPDAWVVPQKRYLDDVSPAEQAVIDRYNAPFDRQIADLNRRRDEVLGSIKRRLSDVKLTNIPEVLRDDVRTALATDADKRSEVQKYLTDKLGPLVRVSPQEVDKALSAAERSEIDGSSKEVTALNAKRLQAGKIQAMYETGPPPPTRLLRRGNHETPGPEIPAGFLRVVGHPMRPDTFARPPAAAKSSGRRTALARWLTQPDHPLTARVFLNRVWQQHFGEGIVTTPDNFGRSGTRPTHPELLDWLATEFVRGGWKLKPLHKLLLTSTVYRQASFRDGSDGDRPDPETVDPGNQLLWRMRLRRVESEVVRDAILAASGKLDRAMTGPSIPTQVRTDGMVVAVAPTPEAAWRRSLYLLARRSYPLSLLDVFDQPLMATNCTRRTASAVPLQALTLINDAFMLEQSEHFAARVGGMAGAEPVKRIETAFGLAFARPPSREELTWGEALLCQQTRRFLSPKVSREEAELKALARLCHMLLCANEFLYAE